MESEAVFRDCRQEFRAGFEVRIVKLRVALVVQEVFVVFRSEKRALMMVEPPRDFGGWRVLEIDNRVLIAGEIALIEQRSRAMDQAKEGEIGVVANALRIETRK
jgi:hypothetical protein